MSISYMMTISRDNNHKWVKKALRTMFDAYDIHKWVIGFEVGKNGYKHYQVRFTGNIEFERLKLLFPDAHIEKCTEESDYERKSGYFICDRDNNSILSCRFGRCRTNQRRILQRVYKQSDRGITCVIDYGGNTGKSWLARHLYERGHGYFVPPTIKTVQGIVQFVASGYNGEPIIVIDIPRSSKWTTELYEAIETIKDGIVYDARYSSKTRDIWGVKVLVFTNTKPKLDKLSNDRWELIDGEGKTLS